jgi:pimeloyl-ACP methyl ester carboxylesterase
VNNRKAIAGYLYNDIPYNRIGHGDQNLIIFQGLINFENKPLPAYLNWLYERYYKYLGTDYTIYLVLPKHGLPSGYTMKNIADDYAQMIKKEFGKPVDIMGTSTGGSIVQHFAADHPELVRKLIIHSSAYTLSETSKKAQMKARNLASEHKWREAYAALFGPMFSKKEREGIFAKIQIVLITFIIEMILALLNGVPKDPTDFIVTVEAEDKHNFKNRLREIKAKTLIVAGDQDPYYSIKLFQETADGIPDAELILYEGIGHPAGGNQFRKDIKNFLNNI